MRRLLLIAVVHACAAQVASAQEQQPAQPVEQPAAAPAPTSSGFSEARPRAEKRIPDWRFTLSNLFVFRWNPLGLENQLRAGYQVKLYNAFDPMFRDNFVHFGIYPRLNPAFVKIGPSLEIQPLSIFNLRVAVEYVHVFGTFGFLQSFPSALSTYSDYEQTQRRNSMDPMVQNYSTSGVHLMIEPLFQIQFGPIALQNKFAAEYWNMRLREGGRVFYDVTLDTLVPGSGWVIANDLTLVYIHKLEVKRLGPGGALRIGARYTTVRPFYSKDDFAPGEDTTKHENSHHRLGPMLAYTFYDKGFTRFNKPTLLLIANWYLSHRWRAGQDIPRAIPYIIVGFAFTSDLMK